MRAALLGAVLVLTALAPAGRAADGWSTGGPFGGTVTAISVHPEDPSAIFAGTVGAGLFKSEDHGKTWRRSSRGLPPDVTVSDVEIARSRPATMYLTSSTSGIFRSRDGGATWTSIRPEIPDLGFARVAVSFGDPDLVLATAAGRVHRSTDGGETWTEINSAQDGSMSAGEVVFAPSNPRVAYLTGGRFWRSDDGGLTWIEPMTPPFEMESVGAIAVHPTRPQTLYAANMDGIWKSADGGRDWNLVHDMPSIEGVSAFDIDERSPDVVYASTSWRGGVLRTSDGGDTWKRIDEDLGTELISDVALDEASGRLYAGLVHLGFFRSKSGRTWSASNHGLVGSMVSDVDFPPRGSRVAYAAVSYQGIARSNDGGGSWRFVKRFRGPFYEIAAASRRRVFVGTFRGVLRTADGGRSWKKIRGGLPRAEVAALEAVGRRVYVGFDERRGFWRSTDGGRTWRRTLRNERFSEIQVYPNDAKKLMAVSSEAGIRFSKNGGRSWRDKAVLMFPDDLAVSAGDPNVMLAGVHAGGVWKSTDGGRTWRQLSGDGVSPDNAQGVAIDPRNPRNLFAGGYSGDFDFGMFRSTDGGRTWRRMEDGLATTWITSVALDHRGRNLIAGTTAYGVQSGGGAFVYRLR